MLQALTAPRLRTHLSVVRISTLSKNSPPSLTAEPMLMLNEPVNSDVNWLDVTLYALKSSVLSLNHQSKGR